jgi:hypothetical protein
MERVAQTVSRVFNTIAIRRTPAEVFDYVTTPATWPTWHPVTAGVSGATDHPLAVGEQVVEDIRSAGGHGRMVWTVRERVAPYHWGIDGESDIGVRAIIRYWLTATADGTRYEREVMYWKPGSFLYVLLDRLFRRRLIWAESEEALRRIKTNLESDPTRPATGSPPLEVIPRTAGA